MTALRVLAAMVLVGVAGFSIFGFLEAFEPGNSWLWQAGYGVLACGCLYGAIVLLWRPGRR